MAKFWNNIAKENLSEKEIEEIKKWASAELKKLRKDAEEYVYVIATTGVEWFEIKHICKTESKARELFDELKEELLKESKRLCKKRPDLYKERIALFERTTFENQEEDYFTCPVAKKYKLS